MGMFDNKSVAKPVVEKPTANKEVFVKKASTLSTKTPTVTKTPVQKAVIPKPKDNGLISQEEVLNWIKNPDVINNKLVCMILGEDGTGKSGLMLDLIHRKLIDEPESRAIILDLDQGCLPLMGHHQEVADRMVIKDPNIYSTIEENDEIRIDVKRLMSVIKQVAITVYKNYKEQRITYFCLDGLSKLLEVAESQMRLDLNKTVSDGMSTMYWKKRKEHFFGVLDILKTLPIHTFYIGHNNFVLTEKTAAVPTQTNAMMFQKILCRKEKTDNGIKLIAEITKSKFNPLKEGKEYVFMHVKDGKVAFNSTKVFEGL